MRIVAGRFRGARIATPDDRDIRPTSDRVREAMFNILTHGIEDFSFEEARVLDLFAGTGALGLEALSRGARYCLFIDDSAGARALLRRNIEALDLTGVTKVWRRDATGLGPLRGTEPFGCAFLDPPYGKDLAGAALTEALGGGWLASGAVIVVEESAGTDIDAPEGFAEIDRRTYGDTQLVFLRAEGPSGAEA